MYRNNCLRFILMSFVALVCSDVFGTDSDRGMQVRFSLAADSVTVTVSGIVTDKATGEPLPGALIRAHVLAKSFRGPDYFERCPQGQVVTDEQGRYRVAIETPLATTGPFKGRDGMCVYASAPGHETLPQYIRPNITSELTEFTCDFALGTGRRLSGVVVDPAGQPVAGALVRVQNTLNGDWNFFGALGTATTNDRGAFEIWIASEAREYLTDDPWLTVLKRGRGATFVWDLLKNADLGTLTLPPCGTIAGRVVDGQGQGVPHCEVSVRGFPCGLIGTTRTDAAGRYVLGGIPGEPSIVDFGVRKNGRFIESLAQVQVFARLDPKVNLRDAANFSVIARDNETVSADDMVVGEDCSVTGRLLASGSSLGLGGLMVRLDTSWEMMVETDIEGNFHFPRVGPGEHRLTVYLPHNLRYDRGIGRTTILAVPGEPVKNVQIQLDDLAELRVQYLDAGGNPLPGVTASATWSSDGGAWTEGTVSDADGWAVLYLYPGDSQYIGGWDRSDRLVTESVTRAKPTAAQIMEPIQVVMVQAATLTGRLVDETGRPVSGGRFTGRLTYADGTVTQRPVATEENGHFTLGQLVPGVVALSLETDSILYENILGPAFEIEPGKSMGLGDISLVDGIDKVAAIEAFFDGIVAEPAELLATARELLEAVRDADYTRPEAWRDFIKPEYCVYTDYPAWVQWICTHLKDNPIVSIELGDVTRSRTEGFWQGHRNIPAVDYQLTLRDGTVLKGVLLFDYDAGKKFWMGMHGLDWHLNDPLR